MFFYWIQMEKGVKMNVFQAVKQSLTTRQVAEAYGFQVKRSGMMLCPFHNDKNPSMKVDKRFHCFGCGEDGDVIDFSAKLFTLGLRDAAVKLAEDFSIPYENWSRASPKEPIKTKMMQVKQKQQEEKEYYQVLSEYFHILKEWKNIYAPKSEDEEWHPFFIEALEKSSYVEYLLDTFLFGNSWEKEELIREYGEEVKKIGKRLSELGKWEQSNVSWKCGRSQRKVGMER